MASREPRIKRHPEQAVVGGLEKATANLRALNVKGEWQNAAARFATIEQKATPEMIALLLEAALANRMLSGSHYNEAERLLTAARALASGNSAELEVLAIVGLGD